MKKIIILLITAILLTGCEATYEINIQKDKINDNIKLYTDSSIVNNATPNQINEFKDKLNEWERGYEYYKRDIYATDKITGYNYIYDFTYEEDRKITMNSDEYGNLLKYENIDEALMDWEYTLMCSDSDNDDDYWLYERAFIKKFIEK